MPGVVVCALLVSAVVAAHGELGRWCDVFEIRDFKIQRCFIYLDPDYAGADTDRYPWLNR